jgi:hypothetical protein
MAQRGCPMTITSRAYMNEEALTETAAALGKAISDAMLEVFDGLIGE